MKPAPTYQPSNLPTDQFHPVILFDGVCNLCNGFVQFVIERDPAAHFRFASLQSDAAAAMLRACRSTRDAPHSPGRNDSPDSVVLVEADRVYTQSTAALRVARRLGFPWSVAYAFVVVPTPVRDAVYAWVARNRYRWFGKRDVCMVATPELRERFLSDD